jgi:hypothetical protein
VVWIVVASFLAVSYHLNVVNSNPAATRENQQFEV